MADGFTLIVPKEMIDRLDVADRKIAQLANTAENAQKKIDKAFSAMASGGLERFIQQLNAANSAMNDTSKTVKGINDISAALSKLSKNSENVVSSPVDSNSMQGAIDNVNRLVESLNKLKALNEASLGIQREGVNYAQQVNDVKELANAEAERARQLEREDAAREKNNRNAQALETQKLANATKELQNAEYERSRQIANEKAKIKNTYDEESIAIKKQANDLKEVANAEAERGRQLILQNKRNIAAYKEEAAELKRITDEIDRQAKAYKEMPARVDRVQLDKIFTQSQSASTINQHLTAIHNLRNAIKDLDRNDRDYQTTLKILNTEINRHQNELRRAGVETERMKTSHSKLLNTTDQLQRKLALLFSVSAVKGYIDKLVAVRGEFEMQTRSLEILLQNKKEANNLWNQTVELAVKSPFTVKQLATYTKQLAAYRIESDKLFETNKMLADVSAGIGVDMQRLILAYGQVKAANFLRGTELRQFSEAGVNMLDELADILTDVEGRMISVGDVFEMVSNRQISFEQVEEVFKRITSPGGLFYQMQEKQSETTKGMMMNLHDSIELMMNDIGISYDGVIKGGIEALKTLVDNWRTIAPIVKTIVYSFGFNLIRKGILSLVPLFSTAGTAVAGFFKAFKTAMLGAQMQMATGASAARAYLGTLRSLSTISFSGWLSIITIMGMVVTAIYQVVSATDKLSEELNRIDQDLSKQLTDNIALYKELADKVNDVTASEYDRNLALDEMKRAFKDILPDEMLRAETIASYGDNYEKAEKAMRSYYNSEKLMQQEEAIEKETLGDIGGKVERLSERLSDTIDINYNGRQEKEVVKRYKDGVSRIINEIVRDVKNGKISASAETLQEELTNRLVAFVNIPEANNALKRAIKNQIWGASDVWVDLLDVSDPLKEYEEKVANIQPLLGATWDEEQLEKQAAQIQQQVSIVQNAYKTIADLASQYASGKVTNWDDILPNINKALQDVQTNAPAYYDALNTVWGNLKANAEEGTFKFNAELQKLGDGFNEAIADVIAKTHEGNDAAINFSEGLREALDDKQLSQQGEAIVQIFEDVASSMELDPNIFAKFVPTAQKSLSDIRNMLEGEITALQDQVRRMNTSMKSGVEGFVFSMLFSLKTGQTPEQRIAELNKLIDAYNLALSRLGGPKKAPKTKKTKKTKTKKSKTSDDPSDDYIQLLEDMYDKFQELSKDMSADAARQEVYKAYKETYDKLLKGKRNFNREISEIEFDTTEGLVRELKYLEPHVAKSKDVWKDYLLTVAEYMSDIKVEKIQEMNEEIDYQVEQLFEGYELFKDIKELGFDKDAAKALFGINATTIKELRTGVNELYGNADDIGAKIDEIGKQMTETYKGNVDLLNREMIPAMALTAKGWEDAGDGYATLFSNEYEITDSSGESHKILVTPILPDGTVLSPDELDKYVNTILNGANDILAADKNAKKGKGKGLVIAVDVEDNGEVLHQLQEQYYDAKILEMAFGTERLEVIKETNDKIDAEEEKTQLERLKKYGEYAKKSVSERAKLKLEELTRLAEIEETFAIKEGDSDEVKDAKNSLRVAAIEKSQKEYADALKKLEWDEFQKSDLFLMMFEDLDSANEKLIRNTLDKIKRYKEEWADMPLEDVRAMTEKINQLESALLKLKSPWNAIKDIDKTISETLGGKTREEVNAEAIDAQAKIDQNNIEIGQLETIRTLLAEGKYISSEQRAIYQQITGDTNTNLETINAEIDARKDANKELNKPIETAKKLTKAEKDKINAYQQQAEAYDKINSEAQKLYDASKELIELFAGDDSIGMMFADMGMSIADSVLSTLSLQANLAATKVQLEAAGQSATSFGMQLNAAMGVVGWIVMGVQVISQVLGAIFGAKDKKLQKEIDKLDEDVEKLSKALEKLEDALEKNYAFASLRSDMQKINSNIDQQIAKRRRQIELEKDKKETDKDQIKDWEDEIEELQEKRAELRKEMIESLGGVDDYRSATREFVDAWVDAFNETGNGLQGLTDNFREFFKNIILEQAVMKGAGKIMEPLLERINTALGDYEIQNYEEQKIKALSEQKMKELDEFLNVLFGDNGMWNEWIDDKGQSLSGLQEGIQGVTEETAQIIEAYLNSIRFYIAQDNQNLADLRNFFIGSEEDTNPIVSQLKMQTELIRAIKDMFSSVIYSGGHPTYGGAFLKVSL